MCGWLPFEREMREEISGASDGDGDGDGSDDDDDDPFDHDDDDGEEESPVVKAIDYLRDQLDLDLRTTETGSAPHAPGPEPDNSSYPAIQSTPLFLAHGLEDRKVPIGFGRGAVDCLRGMGLDVVWCEYGGLGHWYSSEMLADLVGFLRDRVGR